MRKKSRLGIGMMLALSFLVVFVGEVILRQHISEVFKWMISTPMSFMLNWGMIFVITLIFTGLFNRLGRGFLAVSLLYITACIISFYKFKISGQYLIPADLFLIGEATSISKEMHITIEYHVVLSALFIIFAACIVYRIDLFQFAKKQRFAIVLFGMSILGTTMGIGAAVTIKDKETAEVWQSETVNEGYSEDGFLVGFGKEVAELIVEKPEGYSKEKAEDILEPYKIVGEEAKAKEMNIKPNIIMIMSEGFFDINRLPEVKFSENPIGHFDEYRREYAGGAIVTPVYGGRTCQTEYEVLTGHSVDFTGADNIAYMRFVEENTPSIPKLLKEEGYQTLAIHAYEKTFFSRDIAYEDLGIDEFLASEDFNEPKLARGYISDEEVVDKMIESYEVRGEAPLFMHVVTMQNHMPYVDEYRANHIEVEGKKLTKEEKNSLTTYANGVKDSDKALKKLIEYFEKVKEPTVIVMYGDHLPDLGDDYMAYKHSGYIKEDLEKEDYFNLYQTPFVIWNNYDLPSEDFGDLDASYLGSTLLDYIGYNKDPYMSFLNEKRGQIKAYNEAFALDKEGDIKGKLELDETENKILDEMWILQYDRLFETEEQDNHLE